MPTVLSWLRKLSSTIVPDQAAEPLRSTRFNAVGVALVALGIVLAAMLTLHGLGNNAFWDDEANTALFARNWLKTGALTAFDGVNVVGFRQGAELNSKLENIYMPPVQYYVAALGLRVFGNSTVGARLPFLVAGLLSMGALSLFVKWHLPRRVPAWVAVMLLALSPAYLMLIRQCRYYSVTALLTLVVLASLVHKKSSRWAKAVGVFAAVMAAVTLMFANYLNAVALCAILPVFLYLRRYRNLANASLVGAVYISLLVAGLYILRTANPLGTTVSYKDTITGLPRIWRLLVWHTAGLPRFEFFPIVTPLMALIVLVRSRVSRAASLPTLPAESLFLCSVMLVYSVAIVAFSPQTVTESTRVADMRYAVPLMPLGAVATACVLCGVWGSSRMAGRVVSVVTAALIVSTNALSSAMGGWLPLRSTLFEYVRENAHDYVTGNEAIVGFLQKLPRPYVIRIIPDFMTYPAMFYAPAQHYCCQLPDDFPNKMREPVKLPIYVFNSRVLPDYILVGADVEPQDLLVQCAAAFGPGRYHVSQSLGTDFRDSSRPEIPWHSFGPPHGKTRGFTVLARSGLQNH